MEHAPSPPSGPGLQRVRSTATGSSRLRVVPWQGDPYTALLGPRPSGRPPSAGEVARCLAGLKQCGVQNVVTPALSPMDSRPFLDAGLRLHERLHLLSYALEVVPPQPTRTLKSGRPWHRNAVVQIDRLAFEPFWQFDHQALKEARRATPSHRFRVAMMGRQLLGYAVTGRAGNRGYLQRLAVSPTAQGQGLGTTLVNDSLCWLHGRGAKVAMVNTQERNARAFALYQHLGFVPEPEGLVVLRWDSQQ